VREILVQGVRPTDMVARLGGDEFAVWLNNADITIGKRRADNFLAGAKRLAAEFPANPQKPLGMSIGIAVWEPGHETLELLLARADAAMYEAKRGGKGNYAIAPPAETP
jgi:diguanylate cyclase (GGDEF)-like protein